MSDALVRTDRPLAVTEAFTAGKHPDQPSEDVVVITGGYIAVLDGMSSPLRMPGERGSGRDFAQMSAEAILELPQDASAEAAVERISGRLRGLRAAHGGPAGAVAAIYSLAQREVWRIGDVHISIDGVAFPGQKRVDVAMASFRAAVNAAHRAAGASLEDLIDRDPGLSAARPLLHLQPALANRDVPFGYGVLNGSPVPSAMIERHPVPPGVEVILASDGFLSAAPTLDAAESALAGAIARDPACIDELWEMGKALRSGHGAPDDRSYVRFTSQSRPHTRDARHDWSNP